VPDLVMAVKISHKKYLQKESLLNDALHRYDFIHLETSFIAVIFCKNLVEIEIATIRT
jgi:hypothetical protein